MEAERKKWPHTGHWKFVLFQPEGGIKDAHVANMFCAQNWYLRDTIGISVKGFSSLDIMITEPG
eukprot:4288698-Ditylum_brightwellii.AAC.1